MSTPQEGFPAASDFEAPSPESLLKQDAAIQGVRDFIDASPLGHKVELADGSSTHRYVVIPKSQDDLGEYSLNASIIDRAIPNDASTRDVNIVVYDGGVGFHYLEEPGNEPTLHVTLPSSRNGGFFERLIAGLNGVAEANKNGSSRLCEGTTRQFANTTQGVLSRLQA